MFARQAWQLLASAFATVLTSPDNLDARERMLLGAYLAGSAIENSMLGAAHAAANPLTARFNTTHGLAVGLMMPHVIRWNAPAVEHIYRELPLPDDPVSPKQWANAPSANALADCFTQFLRLSDLPVSITRAVGTVPAATILDELAADAALQWTGTFNPRKMDLASFRQLYQLAQ
jgi:alcohol dehydrogenase